MRAWRWARTVLLALWTAENLLLRLGWLALTLGWSKYRAVRRYERELRRAGLPSPVVQELVASYNISLGDLVRGIWGR
uniref:Uncharacterized protein n=2 Tax=Candidatus Bipolaricaulota TaxID=67810 RepID=H5S8H8_9BACT|nr:hypothetical protein HGMM_F01E02C07 [uncultured Acetothermia bacterium]BAL59596.1 hypothetical protein HGMM_OP4C232 [Candidatus Acetothermum autotrophicum]